MSDKLKSLLEKKAAQAPELSKEAMDVYMQGRILGLGFTHEVTGIDKEAGMAAMKEGLRAAGKSAKAFATNIGGKVDNKVKDLGAATKRGIETGAKKVGLGGIAKKTGDGRANKTKRLYGWSAAGAAGAGVVGAGAGIKKAIND